MGQTLVYGGLQGAHKTGGTKVPSRLKPKGLEVNKGLEVKPVRFLDKVVILRNL